MMVLFICQANASRSQMAEGWFNHLTGDEHTAFSAGYLPCGAVSGRAVAVMAEAGVDISNHFSKGIDYFGDMEFDYAVTLCSSAEDKLSGLAGNPQIVHMPLDDPFGVIGSEATMLDAYRSCRDRIKTIVEKFIKQLDETSPDGK
jgi:arsenate reductase (thioredoxin)